jgi:hypothetical protein
LQQLRYRIISECTTNWNDWTAVTEAGRVMANIGWRCRNSTNRGMARKDKEDFIYKTTRENSMP